MRLLLLALAPMLTAMLGVLMVVGASPWLLNAQRPVVVSESRQRRDLVPVVLVRTATGRWLVDGQPVDDLTLERRLAARGSSLLIRFLPSTQLSAAEVSSGFSRLRRLSAGPVLLEQMGG